MAPKNLPLRFDGVQTLFGRARELHLRRTPRDAMRRLLQESPIDIAPALRDSLIEVLLSTRPPWVGMWNR